MIACQVCDGEDIAPGGEVHDAVYCAEIIEHVADVNRYTAPLGAADHKIRFANAPLMRRFSPIETKHSFRRGIVDFSVTS